MLNLTNKKIKDNQDHFQNHWKVLHAVTKKINRAWSPI